MKNSHNIWIPSLQNTLRFHDLDLDQYRCILKIIDDNDLEFITTLNEIMEQNIVSKFDVHKLTTLDRFIVFLSLKINSCGATISLAKKCEKCETVTNIKMDLNQLVDNIAPNIDRRFTMPLVYEQFGVVCDIPTIAAEHEIYTFNNIQNIEFRSLEFSLNNYIFSHINALDIMGRTVDLNGMKYVERMAILNHLPAGLINEVKNQFLQVIHDAVLDIDFLQINCQKCKEHFEIKFDINNINDVLKIIYKDDSIENFTHTILNVCVNGHAGGYLNHLSPMEINSMNKIIHNSMKKDSPPPDESSQDRNLFEEYREQTAHMQESPSEFS